jgi:hypothetical protein
LLAFQPKPLAQTRKLAQNLGVKWNSTQDLIDKLRLYSFTEIIEQTPSKSTIPMLGKPFEFVPCVEPFDSPEPTFLTKYPEEIYRSGNFKSIPLLTGSNSVSNDSWS